MTGYIWLLFLSFSGEVGFCFWIEVQAGRERDCCFTLFYTFGLVYANTRIVGELLHEVRSLCTLEKACLDHLCVQASR